MSATITIHNGTGDSAADGTSTFAGSPSGATGTILSTDSTPADPFESELEGIPAATVIDIESSSSIVLGDLADDMLSLQQDSGHSVTFRTGAGGFSMNAGDTIAAPSASLVIDTTGSASLGSIDTGA